jgi:hypothetical protein
MAGGKRRHEFEISRMSKGDIINGLILFGKTPVFSVIACTQVGTGGEQRCGREVPRNVLLRNY